MTLAPESTSLASNLSVRAKLLRNVREFFHQKNVLEVDTTMLSHAAPVDAFIDVMDVKISDEEINYLHTSPEYKMKRVLGILHRDIYQLSHVFRKGEKGKKHSPEFCMLEWYRLKFSMAEMIEDTLELLCMALGEKGIISMSYGAAIKTYTGLNHPDVQEMKHFMASKNISFGNWHDEEIKTYFWSMCVEPHFAVDKFSVIYHFPKEQAALAKVCVEDNRLVAKRFEIYLGSQELANGYEELKDAQELLERFKKANALRIAIGKDVLPIDHEFLHALKDMPECSGVALGFDRLMMIKCQTDHIQEVLF